MYAVKRRFFHAVSPQDRMFVLALDISLSKAFFWRNLMMFSVTNGILSDEIGQNL